MLWASSLHPLIYFLSLFLTLPRIQGALTGTLLISIHLIPPYELGSLSPAENVTSLHKITCLPAHIQYASALELFFFVLTHLFAI